MNILFDINHPADVHFFRHTMGSLVGQGHRLVVTARDKDVTLPLLRSVVQQYQALIRSHGHGVAEVAADLLSPMEPVDEDDVVGSPDVAPPVLEELVARHRKSDRVGSELEFRIDRCFDRAADEIEVVARVLTPISRYRRALLRSMQWLMIAVRLIGLDVSRETMCRMLRALRHNALASSGSRTYHSVLPKRGERLLKIQGVTPTAAAYGRCFAFPGR